LREQYFLETLSEILKYSFTIPDLEKYFKSTLSATPKTAKGMLLKKTLSRVLGANNNNERLLMEEKIKICKLCYALIQSICKNNAENEVQAFSLASQFQFHVNR